MKRRGFLRLLGGALVGTALPDIGWGAPVPTFASLDPVDTFSRYNAAGLAQDLSDVIYDISPLATPVFRTYTEWQTEDLI